MALVRENITSRETQRSTPGISRSAAWLLLAMLGALGMWGYISLVNIPFFAREEQAAPATANEGYHSDLYPRWYGAREVLLHGRDPYSKEVTQEIQVGFYGHVLDPNNGDQENDQQGFAYPVYTAFVLAPLLPLSF